MRLPELVFVVLLLAIPGASRANPADLEPFRATYAVEWKGMTAGTSVLELKRTGADTYVYSSTNTPRGMFRMALPDAISQASTFKVVDGHVRPQSFRGSDEKEREIDLTFDWERRRVTGVAKGGKVDLEVQPETQDPMSLQIASVRNLAANRLQNTVWMIDGDKLKEYELRMEGSARLQTELGEFDTVIYTSKRAGGDRLTRTWVAPTLGYLPVKAERIRGKKTEFTLYIQSTDR
jgi:hypothetical protein